MEVGPEELTEVLGSLPISVIFEAMDKRATNSVVVEHSGCLHDEGLHCAGVLCHRVVGIVPELGVGNGGEAGGTDAMVGVGEFLATDEALVGVDEVKEVI